MLDGGVYGRLDPGFVPGIGLAGGCLRASLSGCLVSLLLVHGGFDLRFALTALFPAEHAAIISGPAARCQPRCLALHGSVPLAAGLEGDGPHEYLK